MCSREPAGGGGTGPDHTEPGCGIFLWSFKSLGTVVSEHSALDGRGAARSPASVLHKGARGRSKGQGEPTVRPEVCRAGLNPGPGPHRLILSVATGEEMN